MSVEYPLVLVTWRDASSTDAWAGLEDLPEPIEVKTVGFLVLEKPDHRVVCGTYSPDHDNPFSGAIAIPTAWTQSVQKLAMEM